MYKSALWLCAILLIGSGAAADIPFVFDENSADITGYTSIQLEHAYASSTELAGVPALSSPEDSEVIEFPVTGGDNSNSGSASRKIVNTGDLKRIFDDRVDTNSSYVINEGAILAAKYPGDRTIDQICSIYGYLKNGDGTKRGWSYVSDHRGLDYYRYANESLRIGERADCSGIGDCDDFAILMSALVESIGGTTRIILARNNSTGGHAYTEVYLGQLGAQNNHAEEIIGWLKQKFNIDRVYTHVDTSTREIWLNLDWGADDGGAAHPGGPFFQGDKHIVLYIRDTFGKTPLKAPESYQKTTEQRSNVTHQKNIEQRDNETIPAIATASNVTKAAGGIILRDPESASASTTEDLSNLASTYFGDGTSALSSKNYIGAIEAFDKAIAIQPRYALAWAFKGDALNGLGRYEEAVQACDKAIGIDPTEHVAWRIKSESLESLGRTTEANVARDEAKRLVGLLRSNLGGSQGQGLQGYSGGSYPSASYPLGSTYPESTMASGYPPVPGTYPGSTMAPDYPPYPGSMMAPGELYY